MDRYDLLRNDLNEILENVRFVMEALEQFERLPVPSKQIQLDMQLSSTEIKLYNLAKLLRERLLA